MKILDLGCGENKVPNSSGLDNVIATGQAHTIRELVEIAGEACGFNIERSGPPKLDSELSYKFCIN
jgi:GDP-D-mannose dehydratase